MLVNAFFPEEERDVSSAVSSHFIHASPYSDNGVFSPSVNIASERMSSKCTLLCKTIVENPNIVLGVHLSR